MNHRVCLTRWVSLLPRVLLLVEFEGWEESPNHNLTMEVGSLWELEHFLNCRMYLRR